MRCTRTTGEQSLIIQGHQSQSIQTDGKINSTKVHHQEESGNTTSSKSKGTTNNNSHVEGYNKDGYPSYTATPMASDITSTTEA